MKTITLLCLLTLLLPLSLQAAEKEAVARHDSLWKSGHEYRQWIFDQNLLRDTNSNLDEDIFFVADGSIRAHKSRVYFYDNIDLAVGLARETLFPLAFYVFDHTCAECLDVLTTIHSDHEVVKASRDFINVYVQLPRDRARLISLGMMESALSVQFFLPGLRRLRVVDNAERDELLDVYDVILNHCSKLSAEQLLDGPRYSGSDRRLHSR